MPFSSTLESLFGLGCESLNVFNLFPGSNPSPTSNTVGAEVLPSHEFTPAHAAARGDLSPVRTVKLYMPPRSRIVSSATSSTTGSSTSITPAACAFQQRARDRIEKWKDVLYSNDVELQKRDERKRRRKREQLLRRKQRRAPLKEEELEILEDLERKMSTTQTGGSPVEQLGTDYHFESSGPGEGMELSMYGLMCDQSVKKSSTSLAVCERGAFESPPALGDRATVASPAPWQHRQPHYHDPQHHHHRRHPSQPQLHGRNHALHQHEYLNRPPRAQAQNMYHPHNSKGKGGGKGAQYQSWSGTNHTRDQVYNPMPSRISGGYRGGNAARVPQQQQYNPPTQLSLHELVPPTQRIHCSSGEFVPALRGAGTNSPLLQWEPTFQPTGTPVLVPAEDRTQIMHQLQQLQAQRNNPQPEQQLSPIHLLQRALGGQQDSELREAVQEHPSLHSLSSTCNPSGLPQSQQDVLPVPLRRSWQQKRASSEFQVDSVQGVLEQQREVYPDHPGRYTIGLDVSGQCGPRSGEGQTFVGGMSPVVVERRPGTAMM